MTKANPRVATANYTPNVTWTYDQSFVRPTQVQNSAGYSSAYQYNNYITDPFGTAITGGGKLQQITNSPITSSNITFSYDADGRLTNRSINGSANSVTLSYDGISRLISEVNPLCSGSTQFSYTYVDQTPTDKGTFRLAQIGYPNGQTTNFNYYSTTFDERLKQINNLAGGSSSAGISQFNYGYDSAGEITTWGQQQYQLKSGDALSYDTAGQLVADQGGFGVPLPPYSKQHYYSYDSGANSKSVQHDTIQNLLISGTITASTGNLLVTVNDPGLTGGTETVNYAVQAGDTTAANIATNLAAAITADSKLQALGISATPNGPNVVIRSVSSNVTSFSPPPSVANGATETLTLGNNNAAENITVGGTGSGRTITININDASLSGGYVNVSYLDGSSQTAASIAAGLCSYLQTALASTPFTVTQVGGSSTPVITIQSTSANVTNYSFSISGTGTPTETVAVAPVLSGSQTFLIAGTGTTPDQMTMTVNDAGLSAPAVASYTVPTTGYTSTQMATGLVTQINGNTNLQNIGVLASNAGGTSPIITVSSSSVNATTYTPGITSSSAVPSETITTGLPPNGTVPIVIGNMGSGNTWGIKVYDGASTVSATQAYGGSYTTYDQVATSLVGQLNGALSGALSASYADVYTSGSVSSAVIFLTSTSTNATTYTNTGTAGSATVTIAPTVGVAQYGYGSNGLNELQSISAGGAVQIQGGTDRPVQPVTLNSGTVSANMLTAKSFTANPILTAGAGNSVSNDETVTAISGGGTSTTNHYEVNAIGPASKALSYDANGNLTNVTAGSYPQFVCDAENRIVKITYDSSGSNYSQFVYDGLGRCVQIAETGSTSGATQFVWCGNQRCEARMGTGGGTVAAQYFSLGEVIGGVSYYYTKDHLGNIRELTNSSGAVQTEYFYDPYGNVTQTQIASGTLVPSDFQYAGYYFHSRSGLNLTRTRAYMASIGRWINRDPIEEAGGINLYEYCNNEPINDTDPSGRNPAAAGLSGGFVTGLGEAALGTAVGTAALGVGVAALAGYGFSQIPAAWQRIGDNAQILMNQAHSDEPVSQAEFDSAKEHNDKCRQVRNDCAASLDCSDPDFGRKLRECMAENGCTGTRYVPTKGGGWVGPSSGGTSYIDPPTK